MREIRFHLKSSDGRGVSRFPAFLLALFLGACATQAPVTRDAEYSRDQAADVFSAGFEGIASFYISEIDLPALALAGMSGLSRLDPRLGVAARGETLIVTRDGAPFAAFVAPPADDVARWSLLTAAVISAGREVSDKVREANAEDIYREVFSASLKNLDRFSRYTTADEARRNRAHRQGYSGIGITLARQDGEIRVREIFDDSPAARSGLAVGDAITQIDDTPLTDLDLDRVAALLRGPSGTKARLAVVTTGGVRRIDIERADVVEQTVYYRRYGDSAYLAIRSFNEHTSESLRRKIALAAADIGPRLNGIILDLRGNRGGVLRDAVALSDIFIDKGRILLTKGRHPRSEKEFSAREPDAAGGVPLIVLIDGNSASASEVVAGALQDSGRAVLVGSRTYGKGTVQMIVRLPNDGELIITWAKMYTPSGYPITRLGVFPTICSAEYADGDVGRLVADARHISMQASDLLRLRRIAHDLDEGVQDALMRRCRDREKTADGKDVELDLALHMLGETALFDRAFEATLVATRWPQTVH